MTVSVVRSHRIAVPSGCLGLLLTVWIASSTFAQTPVAPPEAPIGQPVRGPEAPREKVPTAEPRHSLWLRAQESWERNPRLREEESDLTSLVDTFAVGAGYTFRGRRGELALNADGSRINYHDIPDLSRWAYGGGLRGNHNFSPRSSFTVRERYTVSAYNPAAILETSGLPISLVQSKSNVANANLAVGVTARTTFNVGVRHELISFDEDQVNPITQTALVNGNVLTVEPMLARRIGKDDAINIGYSYQKNLDVGTGADLQSAYAAWNGRFGRRYGASLSAGATRVSTQSIVVDPTDPAAPPGPPVTIPAKWRPYGAARLSSDFRHGSLDVGYSHSVSQAFGFGGVRTADLVDMNVSHAMGRKTTASATASYVRSRDLGTDALLSFSTWTGGANLRYLLSRRFDLAAGYDYGKTNPAEGSGVGGYTNERIFVALSYGRMRE